MELVKVKKSVMALSTLAEMLEGLEGVRDTKFIEKLIKVQDSIEKAKENLSLDGVVADLIEEIEELQPKIQKYEEDKNEILLKYAAKDENGRPLTEKVQTANGISEVYVMKRGKLIVDLTEEELAQIFKTEEDKIPFAQIDAEGNPIMDADGKVILDEVYNVEGVLRFAELSKLELDNEGVLQKANEINRKIYVEPILASFMAFGHKDKSDNFNKNLGLTIQDILLEEAPTKEVNKVVKKELGKLIAPLLRERMFQ